MSDTIEAVNARASELGVLWARVYPTSPDGMDLVP
jgi:hypothetical protein